VQDDAIVGRVETVDRADGSARRIGAVHARHRYRLLAGNTVVESHDTATVYAPGNLVLVLAGRYTTVALDAALGVTKKFHSCHDPVS
jgi:hypothetical protein